MRDIKYRDSKWLKIQVETNHRTAKSIADECIVDVSIISKWIRRFKLKYKIQRTVFTIICDECKNTYEAKCRKKCSDGKFRCLKCKYKFYNNKPENKKLQKIYNATDKYKRVAKNWNLKRYYNLSIEEYEKMVKDQKGVCSICKKPNNNGRNLSVDHNHKSGKIRGLLCDCCNRAIGVFKDDILTLQNAIMYLIRGSEDKSWDKYFISIAALISTRSKDPSMQIGAVLVKDNIILSTGYNGFPRGCDDTVMERYDRPQKYEWMVHAEENALLNASRQGLSTIGSTIYISSMKPCYKCVRAMIQCGVKKIVCQPQFHDETWEKAFEVSKTMLNESKIEYVEIE